MMQVGNNKKTFKFVRDLFLYVTENHTSNHAIPGSISAHPPCLNFILISNLSSNDMIMPVATDWFGIITFAKNTVANNGDNLISYYAIAVKFCEFIRYRDGYIFRTLDDLQNASPEIVAKFLNKRGNKYYLKKDNREIESVYEFLHIVPDAFKSIGYYIPEESYDYIHCFEFTKEFSKTPNYFEIKRLIENAEISDSDVIPTLVDNTGLIGSASKNPTDQGINLEIAKFIAKNIFTFFFDR